MLYSKNEVKEMIEAGKALSLAADEEVLKSLPAGNWIGGTIPYFMGQDGGEFSEEKVFVTEISEIAVDTDIKMYDIKTMPNVAVDAYDNGYSVLIIPATSDVHIAYAQDAASYKDIFLKPVTGWISGVNLDNLGKISPKIINGKTGEISDQKAVAMHVKLPEGKVAQIGIVNIFEQGNGDEITFPSNGFSISECYINGEKMNFVDYIKEKNIETKLPLVADYSGAMVNVCFQGVDEENKTASLYGPVFDNITYKFASPVSDYEAAFSKKLDEISLKPVFSCNCILNYLYGELEGKKTGDILGPVTFGEIAYQLLNQTLVYVEIL